LINIKPTILSIKISNMPIIFFIKKQLNIFVDLRGNKNINKILFIISSELYCNKVLI